MATIYFLYYWQVPKRYPLIPKFGSIFGYFDWESVQNIFFVFMGNQSGTYPNCNVEEGPF